MDFGRNLSGVNQYGYTVIGGSSASLQLGDVSIQELTTANNAVPGLRLASTNTTAFHSCQLCKWVAQDPQELLDHMQNYHHIDTNHVVSKQTERAIVASDVRTVQQGQRGVTVSEFQSLQQAGQAQTFALSSQSVPPPRSFTLTSEVQSVPAPRSFAFTSDIQSILQPVTMVTEEPAVVQQQGTASNATEVEHLVSMMRTNLEYQRVDNGEVFTCQLCKAQFRKKKTAEAHLWIEHIRSEWAEACGDEGVDDVYLQYLETEFSKGPAVLESSTEKFWESGTEISTDVGTNVTETEAPIPSAKSPLTQNAAPSPPEPASELSTLEMRAQKFMRPDENEFICTVCEIRATKSFRLIGHIVSVHFGCDDNGYATTNRTRRSGTSSQMSTSLRTSNPKFTPASIPKRGRPRRSLQSLNEIARSMVGSVQPKTTQERDGGTTSRWVEHRVNRAEERKFFKCDQCSLWFSDKENFRLHEKAPGHRRCLNNSQDTEVSSAPLRVPADAVSKKYKFPKRIPSALRSVSTKSPQLKSKLPQRKLRRPLKSTKMALLKSSDPPDSQSEPKIAILKSSSLNEGPAEPKTAVLKSSNLTGIQPDTKTAILKSSDLIASPMETESAFSGSPDHHDFDADDNFEDIKPKSEPETFEAPQSAEIKTVPTTSSKKGTARKHTGPRITSVKSERVEVTARKRTGPKVTVTKSVPPQATTLKTDPGSDDGATTEYECTICAGKIVGKSMFKYHIVSEHYAELTSSGGADAKCFDLVESRISQFGKEVKPAAASAASKSTAKTPAGRRKPGPRSRVVAGPKKRRSTQVAAPEVVLKKCSVRVERLKWHGPLPTCLLAAALSLCVKVGQKEFHCKNCHAKFRTHADCFAHTRVVHYGELRNQCHVCSKYFTDEAFQAHIMTCGVKKK